MPQRAGRSFRMRYAIKPAAKRCRATALQRRLWRAVRSRRFAYSLFFVWSWPAVGDASTGGAVFSNAIRNKACGKAVSSHRTPEAPLESGAFTPLCVLAFLRLVLACRWRCLNGRGGLFECDTQ